MLCLIPVRFLANGLLAADGHLAEVVEGTVVNVEVHVALDAWELAHVGVLPELPGALILDFVYIVVGYPVGVLVEHLVVEIVGLELVIGIDDGLHAVVLLYDVKPFEDALLELFVGLLLGLVLYVEHRGQVAVLQFDLLDEVAGLLFGWGVDAVEVVGSARESVLAGLVEVLVEVLVDFRGSLGGLNHDEADGAVLDGALVLQRVPVYRALVVGDVDAVDFVALGIADVAIEGTPTKAVGRHEEVIEEPEVDACYGQPAQPPRPRRQLLQEAHEGIGTLAAAWPVIGAVGSYAFAAHGGSFLRHLCL